MSVVYLIGFIFFAYLMGSIPTSVWIGKSFYGIDVREHGSKNAGATNTFRVLGPKAGIPVFIIDVVKGWIPVFIALNVMNIFPVSADSFLIPIILGIVAVTGHIFPVFAKFKGGKGVATMLGITIALHPIAAGVCALLFFLILIITKYVSFGSLLAGIFFPLLINFIIGTPSISLMIFSILASVTIVITHQKNIVRLVTLTENKTYLFKSKIRRGGQN
jgi:glycerol-3-phosphate acyltransferase PlsY